MHTTGAIVPAPIDVLTVHFCHRAYNRMSVGSRASRDTPAHRVNARLAAGVAEFGERWSLRPSHVRSAIAVSTGVRREVEALYPALRDRLSPIHHGVDLDRFRSNPATRATTRATWDVDLDELVALFVGGDKGRRSRMGIAAHQAALPYTCDAAVHGPLALYDRLASLDP